MQLATYISDLLYRYECVIIPGFGAFLKQYRSATIDSESQTFHPPGTSVMFNRQLQTNDGILANYIASVEQCSYDLALRRIRNFTGDLSLQLSEGKKVTLSQVGEFFMNEENSVQFSPLSGGNFSTASFGLAPISTVAVSREAYKKEVEALEEKTPLLFTPEKRTATPYAKYAAIGLIALTLSGFGGMKIYERGVKDHNFAEKQKAETWVDNEIQEATFVIKNPLPALNITVPKQNGKYHIVAGAFRVEDNAYKKIEQLTAKGYTPKIIGKNRYGLHQVVYSSHQGRLEALKTLRNIKQSENRDAWLLVQELDK